MTKRRLPLTFENALTKVAGQLGWDEVAAIVGQAARTVRRWSEPDTTASISLEASLKLDVAYHASGGDGAPFLTCYLTRFEAESYASVPGREALIAAAAASAKENGEAVSSTLVAAHPNAKLSDFAIAEREIEESINALHAQLSALKARRKAWLDGDREFGGEPWPEAPTASVEAESVQ